MPLARYEIRNEYSLANPDLYRAAPKDDPEGLLEGVAMAGLVGIVRQLGDLAEFAAEVFHDLHEDVLATAARGHELLIRVQQLEAELPLVEKMMLAETNHVNYAYNPGVEWHSSIRNDQNHFTQGDLPRFIRNAYEDCRGPPRLFVLDKFDVAGAGACLKRYTDPSFFKMEWASSELMKAEKEQQDKKARRIKKKGRRERNGEVRDAGLASKMQPRMRYAQSEVENIASTSIHSPILDSGLSFEEAAAGSILQGNGHMQMSSRLLIPEQKEPNLKASMDVPAQDLRFNEASLEPSRFNSEPSKFDSDTMEVAGTVSHTDVEAQKEDLDMSLRTAEDVADDFASETDNYVDALATMDSEVETDSEMKTMVEVDREVALELREEEATVPSNHGTSDCLRKPSEENLAREEDGISNSHHTSEKSDISERIELAHFVDSPQTGFAEEGKSPFVDGSYVSPSIQESNAPTPINRSAASSPMIGKAVVSKSEDYLESGSIDHVPETPETSEENDPDNLQMENISAAFHRLPEPAVPLGNRSQSGFPEHLGSLSSHTRVQSSELLSRVFSASDLEKNSSEDSKSDSSESPKGLSPRSSADSSIQPMRWATNFSGSHNHILDTDDDMDGMQVSSTSPSSSSSTLSSPRPSTLATTVFNMELESKPQSVLSPQGSIESSSQSLPGTSPKSAVSTAPHSPVSLVETTSMSPSPLSTAPLLSTLLTQESAFANLPSSESSFKTSFRRDMTASFPAQSPGFLVDELEHSPPPPPLPPLEWRMTRRFKSSFSSSSKAMEFPATPPSPYNFPVRSDQLPQAFKLSTAGLPTFHNFPVRPDELVQAFKPSTTGPPASHNFSVIPNELVQAFKPSTTGPPASHNFSVIPNELAFKPYTTGSPAPQNLPVRTDELPPAFKPSTTGLPIPQSFPVRLDEQAFKTSSTGPPASHNFTVMPDELLEDFEPSTTGSPAPQILPLRSDDLLQDFKPPTTGPEEDSPSFSASTDDILQDSSPVLSSSEIQEGNFLAAVPNRISTDRDNDGGKFLFSPSKVKENTSARLDDSSIKDSGPSVSKTGVETLLLPPQRPDIVQDSRPSTIIPKIERKDSLIEAIASHDRNTLKKVPEWSQSSRTAPSDDREVLLEQIRTRSFSLRHTKIEKQEPPRSVTHINVAAILEKANAIRQAFAGSDEDDEDDDWSDA